MDRAERKAIARKVWHRPQSAPRLSSQQEQAVKDLLTLAVQLHEVDQESLSEGLCGKVLEVCPGQPDALYLMGVISLERGDRDAALRRIRRALNNRPNWGEAWATFGSVLADEGENEDALSAYATAARLTPHDASAHAGLARSLCRQGKPADAVREYETAIGLDPDSARLYSDLAEALLRMGRLDAADEARRHALRIEAERRAEQRTPAAA